MGFTDLGDINTHLAKFERYLEEGSASGKVMARSMLVLMVRGLNSGLQFPYAQFPCATLRSYEMFLESREPLTEVRLHSYGPNV